MKKAGLYLKMIMILFSSSFHTGILKGAQDDTLYIRHTKVLPVIDGYGNDECWKDASWQKIDQVWIPWGEKYDNRDFEGAYKVLWSSDTNMLYFLIRTKDDVLVDDYIPGITADIYNFDIVELFIDEDRSRGRHAFNVPSTGENAENAFGYHMHVPFPSNGMVTDSFRVQDLAGSSFDDRKDPVYNSHYGAFHLGMYDDVAYWEFSLKVYGDNYCDSIPEDSRIRLKEGKIMGLSIAYCDNDDPAENPYERDYFIGSVWVPLSAYNDHWQDAEYFGTAKLISGPSSRRRPEE